MGGQPYQKFSEKITMAIVNENSQKINKLKELNKPIVSVLWLEGCIN